ncbi:phage tail tape measure protein [Pseudomonas sp. RGM2987]|uniref:phage tail tape measure protein n=1 Tax=Pseudomonas sp. RGM2987 TaxID=2930090 RepID=UPI001FD69321|nr:phage tail tape measure protein [Pseudomonas sp. RGM2987]MCJ8207737.1 phage tail tape measure protein [Pseudomonas sp. RGM2987]
MTQDIASLGIKVETGDVAKASTELDSLAQAGAKAEKATESLTTESKKAGASIKVLAAETRAAEVATAKLAKQTENTGISAKQTANALRGVPAQVTDIVTSLQGGQAPLTVLLQQGGQLKDMFGGIAPAARALGGYVAGLVNPFTLAAAAAAALGLAYFKGSEEAPAYSKALILTGNAAGTSGDQLSYLAQQVSATIGTTGAAAEVLAKLAGNGRIASESFGKIATEALEMEKATGKAIDETIAEFAKIAKDPVAAAKELNDQYNFLTASVYSQIVALKEQGDTIGAAKLLTDTYADTIKTRATDVTANLGLIETAWKKVKSAAAGALDATLDVGRAQSMGEQLAEARAKLADLELKTGGNSIVSRSSAVTQERELLKSTIEALTNQLQTQQNIGKAQKNYNDIQREGIEAAGKLKAISDSNLTNEEKRNKLIKEYKRDVEALRKADPNSPLVQADVVAKNIQNINDKNKDPAGKANQLNLSGYNDAQNAIKDLQATYSNSEKELEAQQKAGLITQQGYIDQRTALIRAEREEVTGAYQAEIAALEAVKEKTGTTGQQRIELDQKIADARTNMIKAQKDADSQLEVLATNEEGRLKKQTLAIQTYTSALQQQVVTLRQQGQREAASLGMGDRQRNLQSQLNGIDDKANAQRIDLANQYGDGSRGMSLDEYNAKLQAIAKSQKDLRDTVTLNFDDMTEAQGSWAAGASSAWQNYLESARDVAGQTKSLFTNAFSSMEDAIVNFAMTGKLSFADFAKSILADMARIATRAAASSAMEALFGLAASAAGSYLGGASSAGSTQAGYSGDLSSFTPGSIQAKGGAWSGGVQMFANGGAFTNSIVSKPTAFGMARGGIGVMGEAGEEAIMPLTRTAGGKLGVMAMGGGAAGATQINVEVHIDGDGNASSTADAPGYDLFGKELATFVEQKYQELRTKDMRQGGVINNAIKGR